MERKNVNRLFAICLVASCVTVMSNPINQQSVRKLDREGFFPNLDSELMPSSPYRHNLMDLQKAMKRLKKGFASELLLEERWSAPWEGRWQIPQNLEVIEVQHWSSKKAPLPEAEVYAQQQELTRLRNIWTNAPAEGGATTGVFAGGLAGEWKSVGPHNMPGCWDQAYLDSATNTVWGVTCSHYSNEFGGTQFVFKGSLNGDDFKLINGNYPIGIHKVFGVQVDASMRTMIVTMAGKFAYTDDNLNWTESSAISNAKSMTLDRKNKIVYVATTSKVYKSTDFGVNWSLVQDFGTATSDAHIYTPLYGNQPGVGNVYLSRNGTFYVMSAGASAFTQKGTWSWPGNGGLRHFSIGGDSRRLYVTSESKYYYSTNEGATWAALNPQGADYGGRGGTMWAGHFLGVSPSNPNKVIGGYICLLLSTDGLVSTTGNCNGNWGLYQNQTTDAGVRNKYHPDFQSTQIFYDKTGKEVGIISSDGGLIRTYEGLTSVPTTPTMYSTTMFYNITLLGTPTAEIYTDGMITGTQNPEHLFISTQDQGGQRFLGSGTGENISVHQVIGGDGPSCFHGGNDSFWCEKDAAATIVAPRSMYESGVFKGMTTPQGSTTTGTKGVLWQNTFVDKASPNNYTWILGSTLSRFNWTGSSWGAAINTTKTGGNKFAGMAQSPNTSTFLVVLKGGKLYKSADRGATWDAGVATGMSDNGASKWDRCGSWILHGNDNWILAACPSTNGVVSVLSKDKGATWKSVSAGFPNGFVNGMQGTPDGKFVLAGTQYGPYAFNVAQEKWYNIASPSVPWFNTTAMNYLPKQNVVRFGTWGTGVWDFKVTATNASSSSVLSSSSSANSSSSVIVASQKPVQGAGMPELGYWDKQGIELRNVAEYDLKLMTVNGKVLEEKTSLHQSKYNWQTELNSGLWIVEVKVERGMRRWMIRVD